MTTVDDVLLTQRDEIISRLTDMKTIFDSVIDNFNSITQEAWLAVEKAREPFEEALMDAQRYVDTVAMEINTFIQSKPDKWHASERGRAYQDWLSEYSDLEIGPIHLRRPDDLTYAMFDNVSDTLKHLPNEVAGEDTGRKKKSVRRAGG